MPGQGAVWSFFTETGLQASVLTGLDLNFCSEEFYTFSVNRFERDLLPRGILNFPKVAVFEWSSIFLGILNFPKNVPGGLPFLRDFEISQERAEIADILHWRASRR